MSGKEFITYDYLKNITGSSADELRNTCHINKFKVLTTGKSAYYITSFSYFVYFCSTQVTFEENYFVIYYPDYSGLIICGTDLNNFLKAHKRLQQLEAFI